MRIPFVLAYYAAVAAASYVPGKAFDRFLTIWLENQDFLKVEKNPEMKELAKEGIILTQYYAHTHPSQPNYLASICGEYFGLNHDGLVTVPQNVSTLIDLLDTQNIGWKGYFEGMPGPGYMSPGSSASDGSGWHYVRKHNPFVTFESITLNGTRRANVQSLSDFYDDLKANTLPQFMFMSPDMLNDGHNTTLEFAATWSRDFLTPLLANEQFMEKTLVLLTYDESLTYEIPNHIVSILLGGAVPPELKNTFDDTFYTHYSILSTLENNWSLPNLGRYDVGANVFEFVAHKTGYVNRTPPSVWGVNNSLSYAGFLNNNANKYAPIPPPNLRLVGAGGKGVESGIAETWKSAAKEKTPYDGSGAVFDGGDGIRNLRAPIYKDPAPNTQ
ncbi:phosphoesterase family-domain-containing protein [Xylogone sp. PMI_703]|nr:phosphoesterase family-domain-containing protein [Xylogone sp. PMI_703]